MEYILRPATAADQAEITAIVREARIYPRGLDWPRFIVADVGGRVVGTGQVRLHRDGSREMASIAVRPDYQRFGIGSAICRALVAREAGVLYLTALAPMETYYQRFSFFKVTAAEMPPDLRRMMRLAAALGPLIERMAGARPIVMKRERSLPDDPA
jgi:N-acetylglutamate synthase-like GNAT family acetyltransferase